MEKAATSKEPLCKQKIHRKVLDKGIPDDAMPALKYIKVKNISLLTLKFHFINISEYFRKDYLPYRYLVC